MGVFKPALETAGLGADMAGLSYRWWWKEFKPLRWKIHLFCSSYLYLSLSESLRGSEAAKSLLIDKQRRQGLPTCPQGVWWVSWTKMAGLEDIPASQTTQKWIITPRLSKLRASIFCSDARPQLSCLYKKGVHFAGIEYFPPLQY